MRIGLLVVGVALAVCGAGLWSYFYADEQSNRLVQTGSSGAFIGNDRLFEGVMLVVAAIGGILILFGSLLRPAKNRAAIFEEDRAVR